MMSDLKLLSRTSWRPQPALLAGLGQISRMLVSHGMIADLVSLGLESLPISQAGGLRDDEEKGGAQMALVEFGSDYVEMHSARVVKRE